MDDKAFGRVMTSFRGTRTWVWAAAYSKLLEAKAEVDAARATLAAALPGDPDRSLGQLVGQALARLDLLEAKEANRTAMRDPDEVCVEAGGDK